jgi:hypothetical protein
LTEVELLDQILTQVLVFGEAIPYFLFLFGSLIGVEIALAVVMGVNKL